MNLSVVSAALLATLTATSAAAQSRDSVTVDFTLGSSSGTGGRRLYADRDGIGATLVVGIRNSPRTPLAPVYAAALDGLGTIDFGDSCLIDPTATHGCAPPYPSFVSAGLLGGVELGDSRAALRALVGPAYVAASGRDGLGAQLHLDASAGTKHVALVGALRRDFIRRFDGEPLHVSTVELGLRIR